MVAGGLGPLLECLWDPGQVLTSLDFGLPISAMGMVVAAPRGRHAGPHRRQTTPSPGWEALSEAPGGPYRGA